MRRYKDAPPPALVIPREEFIRHYWSYKPGEHATFAGPAGWGKTQLMNELLAATATERLQANVLCMKNRDRVTAAFVKDVPGFSRIQQWPPNAVDKLRARHPRGWVVWPKRTHDPDVDADRLYYEFRKTMLASLKAGKRIIVADDMLALCNWLGLRAEIRYLYWNGRSDDCGLWGAIQRPADAPGEAYSQSHHIFFANSPEKRDRDRYREIGGIASETIEYNLERLQKWQWLYVHRESGGVCIVDK